MFLHSSIYIAPSSRQRDERGKRKNEINEYFCHTLRTAAIPFPVSLISGIELFLGPGECMLLPRRSAVPLLGLVVEETRREQRKEKEKRWIPPRSPSHRSFSLFYRFRPERGVSLWVSLSLPAVQFFNLSTFKSKCGDAGERLRTKEETHCCTSFFRFWFLGLVCLILFAFQSPQRVAFGILSRNFSCN